MASQITSVWIVYRLFRRRSKKTSKLHITGLCEGNSPVPMNSPHKGPVTRKMFPFDDVTMSFLREGIRVHQNLRYINHHIRDDTELVENHIYQDSVLRLLTGHRWISPTKPHTRSFDVSLTCPCTNG